MFKSKKVIFYITRNKFLVSQVSLGKNPKRADIGTVSWTETTLTNAFKQIKSHLRVKNIRLLLDDNLSYLLLLKVPPNQTNQREYIANKVSESIPEVLSGNDWDYARVQMSSNTKSQLIHVVVFAPVKAIWQKLIAAFNESGINFEAVESVNLAKKRHPDPIIGLALKTDLKGKDSQVLNLQPSSDTNKTKLPSKPTKPKPATPKDPVVRKGLLIALIVTLVLAAVALGGIFISRQALNQKTPEPSPNEQQLLPTPTPQPKYSHIKIQVQAPTGDIEEEIIGLLNDDGFDNVSSIDANSGQEDILEIRLKPTINEEVFDTLKIALESDYEIKTGEPLTEDSDYDLVILGGREDE